MISDAQLRAARGLLGWNQHRLAESSGVSLSTIRRMESSEGLIRGNAANVWKIQQALEDVGIEFTNGDAPGVRLKHPQEKTDQRRITDQI